MSATVISNAITVNSREPGGAATITSPRLRSPCAATASSRNNILVMAMLRLRAGSNCEGGGAHLRLPARVARHHVVPAQEMRFLDLPHAGMRRCAKLNTRVLRGVAPRAHHILQARLPEIAEGEGARKTVLQRHHRRIGFDDERRYQFGERHIVRGGRRIEHSG